MSEPTWEDLIASVTTLEELRQSINLFNFVPHSGRERRQFLRLSKDKLKQLGI